VEKGVEEKATARIWLALQVFRLDRNWAVEVVGKRPIEKGATRLCLERPVLDDMAGED